MAMPVRSQSSARTALHEPLRSRARVAGAARWPLLLGMGLGLLLVVLMAGEAAARFLGFGQPPLAMRDQITEYRLLPDREYRRFGNRIAINRYGMRSDDFRREELDAVHHVLLVGDSIVYGEHQVDQSQTLAQHWQRLLRERNPGQPWLVSAAAVASWGPANQLAYLLQAGPFPAQRVVLVVSSHDLSDAPTGLDADLPYRVQPPMGALHDLALVLQERSRRSSEASPVQPANSELPALRSLVSYLVSHHAQVLVVFHPARFEWDLPRPLVAETLIAEAARAAGAEFASALPAYRAASDAGVPLYRDGLHLTSEGNRVLVEWLHARSALASR
jgi:lysophospholipase L1-like esterase